MRAFQNCSWGRLSPLEILGVAKRITRFHLVLSDAWIFVPASIDTIERLVSKEALCGNASLVKMRTEPHAIARDKIATLNNFELISLTTRR
ncbi:MAG: hypothetical protein SGI77_26485 [Pirellulaceae bacterium]|nr:hypothetical protein [Pirellulaceae bacterium]